MQAACLRPLPRVYSFVDTNMVLENHQLHKVQCLLGINLVVDELMFE